MLTGVLVNGSKSGQVVLTNNGAGIADPLSIVVTGKNFALDPAGTTCTTSLQPGASCLVGYRYTPGPETDTGGLMVATTVASVATAGLAAALQRPPVLAVAPESAPFAAIVGTESASLTLTFANRGEATTGLLTAAIGGPDAGSFRIVANTCTSLAAGSWCTISVAFNTATAGTKTASLTMTDSTDPQVTESVSFTGMSGYDAPWMITGNPSLGTVQVGKTGAPVIFSVRCPTDRQTGLCSPHHPDRPCLNPMASGVPSTVCAWWCPTEKATTPCTGTFGAATKAMRAPH